jgi:hypothetical protein
LAEACHIFAGDKPSKGEYLLELEAAADRAQKSIVMSLPGASPKIVLCTSNMRRWQNGVTACLYNCCLLWSVRRQVVYCVCGFGEDASAMSFLEWACEAAICEGFLFLCSGGEAAVRSVTTAEALSPWPVGSVTVLRNAEGEAVPPFLKVTPGEAVPPVLEYWHASIAKNTAHFAATYVCQKLWQWDMTRAIMVNLDADNLIMLDFCPEVARLFYSAQYQSGTICQAGTNCSTGTCGRLAYLLADFEAIGGYDCDGLYGMGYQDIDLRDRIRTLPHSIPNAAVGEAVPPTVPPIKGKVCRLQVYTKVGGALPNDTTDRKEDRTTAKTRNTTRAGVHTLTWGQMNAANHQLCCARLAAGQVVRNSSLRFNCALWVLLLDRRNLPDRDPLEDFTYRPAPFPLRTAVVAEAVPATTTSTQQRRVRFEETVAAAEPPTAVVATVPARLVGEPRSGTEAQGPPPRRTAPAEPPSRASSSTAAAMVSGALQRGGAPATSVSTPGPVLLERPNYPEMRVVKLYVLGLEKAPQVRDTVNTPGPQRITRIHFSLLPS